MVFRFCVVLMGKTVHDSTCREGAAGEHSESEVGYIRSEPRADTRLRTKDRGPQRASVHRPELDSPPKGKGGVRGSYAI